MGKLMAKSSAKYISTKTYRHLKISITIFFNLCLPLFVSILLKKRFKN